MRLAARSSRSASGSEMVLLLKVRFARWLGFRRRRGPGRDPLAVDLVRDGGDRGAVREAGEHDLPGAPVLGRDDGAFGKARPVVGGQPQEDDLLEGGAELVGGEGAAAADG